MLAEGTRRSSLTEYLKTKRRAEREEGMREEWEGQMGNGQMGTARGEEVAEAAGGGETGGAVERERLAELRVLLCTRVHEVRTARTSERTSTRTNTEYISNRSGQRAQRLRWRLIGGATRTRTRVCDVGHESDQRADRRDHQ